MPRARDEARRQQLLDAVIESAGADGIGTRSLRDLAAAVGTSHRMLLHHFGSRDELLVAVVEEVERRQAATLAALAEDPGATASAMWADLRREELRPFERLFFECYARGAQGEQPFARLHPGAVERWLSVVSAQAPDVDPALVRLGLAVTRGLLLDLVATGDGAGVDAAYSMFLTMLGSQLEDRGAPDRPATPR